MHRLIRLFLFTTCILVMHGHAQAQVPEVVWVEGMDSAGQRLTIGPGVVVKDGYVAINYHYVAGMSQVQVFRKGDSRKYFSDGYLDVNEQLDLIVLSVPNFKGTVVPVFTGDSIARGTTVQLLASFGPLDYTVLDGLVNGPKEVGGVTLTECVSRGSEEITGGPVFYQGKLAGFVTAGFLDSRWFSYHVAGRELLPLLKRSFIIKDFSWLANNAKDNQDAGSHFQSQLIESLNSILWTNLEDAMALAAKKKKKVIVDIYTNWCGWCKLMDKNSFSPRSIISYINENYFAVRLNAETSDSITFQGRLYQYLPDVRAHELAWSLLKGNMSYPALVFIDEDGRIITIVSGYLDPLRLEAALHFFRDNVYKKPGSSFQDYEQAFRERKLREQGSWPRE